jgi:hypothetical protein
VRADRGRIRQIRPKGEPLVFQFNPSSVTPAGGGARYETIERPLRKDATLYSGQELESFSFTLFMDGFPDRSIEDDLEILTRMARPIKKGERGPLLRFDYGPRGPSKLWVIPADGLSWGAELRRSDLQRIRAEVTVTLLEYEAIDLAVSPIKKQRDTISGSIEGGPLYITTEGETLTDIALAQFGQIDRWHDIALLNDIRDPRWVPAGTELILPEV